jgi:hypothetical protein
MGGTVQEMIRCGDPKCTYKIEASRADQTLLVWIDNGAQCYAATVPVMSLREDGLTIEGHKWARFTV